VKKLLEMKNVIINFEEIGIYNLTQHIIDRKQVFQVYVKKKYIERNKNQASHKSLVLSTYNL